MASKDDISKMNLHHYSDS